jgi:Domain of unknown function (DUF4286)
MLVYNVTYTLDLDICDEWLRWMKETHIADIMSTGFFIDYRLCQLLTHDHDDAKIYTLQYTVKDMPTLHRFIEVSAPAFQQEQKKRYEGKYAVFRTIMEVVERNEK